MNFEEAWPSETTGGNYPDNLNQLLRLSTDSHGGTATPNYSTIITTFDVPTAPISNLSLASPSAIDCPLTSGMLDLPNLHSTFAEEGLLISPENTNDGSAQSLPGQQPPHPAQNNPQPSTEINDQEAIAAIATALRNSVNEHADRLEIQAVVTEMSRNGPPRMRMHIQPKRNHRFRYRSENIRYIEGSRRRRTTIKLPLLTRCLRRSDQIFAIQATIVTTRRNPRNTVYIHQHEICYNGGNAEQDGLHSFRIPLTDADLRSKRKVFRRIRVIKARRGDYIFELTPFDPLIDVNYPDYYTVPDEHQLTTIQKAKRFDQEYHTDEYRIVFELVLKQNERWHRLGVFCETRVVTDN